MSAIEERVKQMQAALPEGAEFALIGAVFAHEGYFDNAKPLNIKALDEAAGSLSIEYDRDTLLYMKQRFGIGSDEEAIAHLDDARSAVRGMMHKLAQAEITTCSGKTPDSDLLDALFSTIEHEVRKDRAARKLS